MCLAGAAGDEVGAFRRRLADALDELVEADGTDWPAALGNEYVGVFEVVAP